MKHNIIKSIIIALSLITISVGQAWADQTLKNGVWMQYSFNGSNGDYTYYKSDNNSSQTYDLGTLSSGNFRITQCYWKNNANWTPSKTIGLLYYSLDWGSSWTSKSVTGSGGNGDYEVGSSSLSWVVASSTDASGSYTFTHYFEGQYWWGSGSSDYNADWVSNNSNNYKFTFKIAPPAVSGFTVTPSGEGYLSGSGTSADPYIMKHDEGNLVLTMSGSKAHADANSSAQYYNGSSWSTTATKTIAYASGSTEKQSITLKMRYKHKSETLYGAESSKTVYYQRENAYTVTTSVTPSTGGTATGSSSSMGRYSGGTITATPNTGYTFTRWDVTSGTGTIGSATTANTTYKPTSNSTVRATFTAKTYAITLNKNGGTANGSATATYNSNTLTGYSGVTRLGYLLDGYYTAASGGSKVINADGTLVAGSVSGYTSSGYWTRDAATTLYAHWMPVWAMYNNTTKLYDFEYVSATSYRCEITGTTLASNHTQIHFKKDDATWYFTGADDPFSHEVLVQDGAGMLNWPHQTSNMTLYLTYKSSAWYLTAESTGYAVTLNRTDGSVDGSATAHYWATALSSITPPTRSGYSVEGYYKEVGLTNLIADADGTLHPNTTYTDASGHWTSTGAVTLYAKWSANSYNWYLKKDATTLGTFTDDGSNTFHLDYNLTAANNTQLHFTCAELSYSSAPGSETHLGYDNKRTMVNNDGRNTWYDGVGKYRFHIVKVSGTWYLYADKLFNVTYYGNSNTSGSVPTDATDYTSGTTVTVKSNSGSLARTGYDFGGWNTNSSGTGTNYTAGTGTFSITSDVTLYAKWIKKTTTITLNGNEGTGGSSSITGTYGSALPSFTKHTRTNYTLNGYYTSSSGGVKIINPDGTLVASVAGYTNATGKWTYETATLTLYAQWTETKYTVNVALAVPASSGGTTSPNGDVSVGAVTPVVITAPMPATGYLSTGRWTATGGVTIANPTATSTTITATSAGTVRWTFDEDLTTNYVLNGGSIFGGSSTYWNQNLPFTKKSGESTGSVAYLEVPITTALTGDAANTNYNFKVVNTSSDTWYGLAGSGDWWYFSNSGEQTMSSSGNDIQLRANVVGTYTFKLDYTSTPKITVTWPIALQIYRSTPNDATNVSDHQWDSNSGTTYTWQIDLNANTTYEFKINDKGAYYGYDTNDIETSISATTFSTGTADTRLVTKSAGTFTFTWNSSTHKLAIQYPKSAAVSASPESIYTGETTTLTAYASELGTGSHTIQYEFFKGTTLTDANKIATKSKTVAGTYQSVTQNVTVDFAGNNTSQIYTVRMSEGGVVFATNTVTVYRKWDIYVHDVAFWGGMYNYMYNNGVNTEWPGVNNSDNHYNGGATWYIVTLDAKYPLFILNNNEGNKQTSADGLPTNITTYIPGTFWYTSDGSTNGGKTYYTLTRIDLTTPTVTLTTAEAISNTQIRLVGTVTNQGGDGSTVAELKDYAFYLGDTKYTVTCTTGSTFTRVISGLTAGTTYTAKAHVENIVGTAQSATQDVTTRSGSYTIKIQVPHGTTNVYVYAYTEADCGGTTERNAAFPGTKLLAANKEITGISHDWWTYTMSMTYNKFIISSGTSATQTSEINAPLEDKCYWFLPSAGTRETRSGEMMCPYVTPQLMIETAAGNNNFVYHEMSSAGTNLVSYTISLSAESTYKFKIVNNAEWYGNSGTMTAHNRTDWTMSTAEESNCQITTNLAGEYIFTFNTSTGKLTVTYPIVAPVISLEYSEVTTNSVHITGTVTFDGNSDITSVKFKRSDDTEFAATLKDATTIDRTITGLTPNSTNRITLYSVSGHGTDTYTIDVPIPQRYNYTIYVKDNVSWGTMYEYQYTDNYPASGIKENPTSLQNSAWTGSALSEEIGSDNWYAVNLSTDYASFILNNNNTSDNKQQTEDITPNTATYSNGSHWRLNYTRSADSKTYYELVAVTAPTVVMDYTEFNATTITLSAHVTNYGNEGSDLSAFSAYGFTVKDNVTGISTDYTEPCETHLETYWYFEHTVTGLIPGRSYTVTAWARHHSLKGSSASTTQSTKPEGGKFVKVKNDMNWYEINLYAYASGKCETIDHTYEMIPLGDNWYYAYVSNEYNFFKLNDASTETNILTIEEDCYTNKKDGVNRKLGKTDCPSINLYQVEIQVGDTIYHSNSVSNTTDTLSFYTCARATTTLIKFNGTSVTRTNISSAFSSYTVGDVFTAKVASAAGTSLTAIARYTGSFYVRTDGTTGTWNDYKDGAKTMYKFENNTDYPNEYYNHYWCAYLHNGTNVKAQVANRFNENLSITLPNFNLPRQDAGEAYEGTNVRFAYNNTNNLFEVKFLRAANGNFLELFGHPLDGDNNHIYTFFDDGCESKITYGTRLSMNDLSDWMYQADLYINIPSSPAALAVGEELHQSFIRIVSNYYERDYTNPATAINLGGTDPQGTTPFLLTGTQTEGGIYLMRVIYDYKTNRVVLGWLPNGDEMFDGILDANMMIIRQDNNPAQTIMSPTTNKTITQVHRVYGVLEIDRDTYLAQKATGNKFYWISLPFDVKIKDIFGIDGFKTKWNIQRYRGDLRAANGYHQGETFWRNMNATETAKMEKGRGYVVKLDLEASDFKDVTRYNEVTKETETISTKRLFFPSDNGDDDMTLEYNTSATITTRLPNNECTLEGRRKYDSNWYVAGVPGYNDATITPLDLSADPTLAFDSTNLYYFYNWSWNPSGDKQKDNYTPTAVAGYTFKPFYSYMFQYGGTLNWSNDITTSVISSMPARRDIMQKKATPKEQLVQINLDNEDGNLDRMFITLSERTDVTTDFDLNKDLIKIMNEGSQVYTTAQDAEMAGNVIPYETEQVPMGVFISEEGTYTFNLEDITGNKIVYLYDKETGLRTCLTYDDYDVTLEQGTYDNRFFIEFAQSPSITTDIETESGSWLNVTQHNDMLYIEGINNGEYINMFDMTGRQIISTRYNTGEGIPTPAAGIYLISTKETTHKIVVQ